MGEKTIKIKSTNIMDNSTAAGTIGGTILSVVAIPSNTIITTMAIAAIGATVSFFVSLILKKIFININEKPLKLKKK